MKRTDSTLNSADGVFSGEEDPVPPGGAGAGWASSWLDALPDGLCVLSAENQVVACNAAFAKESGGRIRAPQPGLALRAWLSIGLADALEHKLWEVRQSGRTLLWRCQEGVGRELHLIPLGDQGPDAGCVLLWMRQGNGGDSNLLLREGVRQLGVLLEALPGMIYQCSNHPGWPMVYASQGALALTGYPSGAFSRQDPFLYAELIHPEDRQRVWETVQAAVRANASFELEYRIRCADGTEKWVWEKGCKVGPREGCPECLEGFILDITSRHDEVALRDERVRDQVRQARLHKVESLSRMAGAIAHHFNNKLQAVIGGLDLAETRIQTGCAGNCPILQDLDLCENAAREAAQVSQSMLTYLGKTLLEPHRLDLRALVDDYLRKRASSGRIFLESGLEQELWIRANDREVRELLGHLLDNAEEAKPGGTVLLRLRHSSRGGEMALLEVQDEGAGVDPSIRDQIFDPFFSTKFTGRGLGLSMVLGIVNKLGGAIALADAPGGGALFRVWLPLDPES